MNLLERIRRWCQEPPRGPISTKLRRHATPIAVLFTATVLAVSISLFSLPYVTTQPMTQPIPLSGTPIISDEYSSIQMAIDNAAEGDTVYVKPGVYHENLRIEKTISLIGEGRDSTIIDGNSSEGYRTPVVIVCNGVNVTGLTLREGYIGIQSIGNNTRISGNRISGVQYGIQINKAQNCIVSANIIESASVCGIQLNYAINNTVQGNQVFSASRGIEVMGSGYLEGTETENFNVISENVVAKSKEYALRLLYTRSNTLVGNNVTDSAQGVAFYYADSSVLTRNNFINNVKVANPGPEHRLDGDTYSVNNWSQNYYSDYQGVDSNDDGFGDAPYVVNEKNSDYSPLMAPNVIQEPISVMVSDSSSQEENTKADADIDGNPNPIVNVYVIAGIIALVLVVLASLTLVSLKKRRK